jgi:hypothetical protein
MLSIVTESRLSRRIIKDVRGEVILYKRAESKQLFSENLAIT